MSPEENLRAAYSFYRKAADLGYSDEEKGNKLRLLRYAAENIVKVIETDPDCEVKEVISSKETIFVSTRWLAGATLVMEGNIRIGYPLEQHEESIAVFEKAVGYLPGSVLAWNGLTKACAGAYRREDALRANAKALEADPNDETARKYRDALNGCPTIGVEPPGEPFFTYSYGWNFILCIPIGIIGIIGFFTRFQRSRLSFAPFCIWYLVLRVPQANLEIAGYKPTKYEPPRTL